MNTLKTDTLARYRALEEGICNKYDAELDTLNSDLGLFIAQTRESKTTDDEKFAEKIIEI